MITEDYLGRNNNLGDNAWHLEMGGEFSQQNSAVKFQVLAFQVRKDWFKENGED